MTAVSVIITARAVMVGAESAKAGERLNLDPLVAGDLVDVGRAVLCDKADAAVIAEVRRAALRETMRHAGAPTVPGSPWSPWR